ncbi:MAG: glycosyltransferase family 4 protein [Bacteroidetes bacterium]|nr:glycosyltransferase family 4 protein [Bacteroidota bacterium]
MSRRTKIVVNTRFLIKNKLEGIGLFTFESLKRMTQAHPEVDFTFLFDSYYEDEFLFGPNVIPMVILPPARRPILWYWWFEIEMAIWLKRNPHDLFLSTDSFGCLRSDIPQVLVMHDLSYEHFKNQVPWLSLLYYRYFIPRYARKAARIATVSEFSKEDIVKYYDISPDKIDVVYNGAKEVYRPIAEDRKQEVKEKYSDGKNYFVYVGSIHPRKNVGNLLQAFEQFKTGTGSDFQLLIVGRKAWKYNEVEQIYKKMKHQKDVSFLGHIPSEDLGEIVAAAFAMVYVSLFEGFGIPIIEAMSCEVPVITSNVSSMPEAAGDAALLVNPLSVEEISSAMKKLSENDALRQALIEKGKEQIKKFSWELTAQKLWNCCEKVLVRNR